MSLLGYSDANASLSITTTLGVDALLLRRLSGTEDISGNFLFNLEMETEHTALDIASFIGTAATVNLVDGDGNTRLIHGLVTRVAVAGSVWHAELRPWFWMLNLTTDNRIFQTKSIPDIITAVFDGLGYSDYKTQLTGSYSPLDYCVQYQETSFNFVNRLMEQAGIWCFYEHTGSAHTLVLADDPSAVVACENAATVTFLELSPNNQWLQALPVYDVALAVSVASGKYQADDFNFITPSTALTAVASGIGALQVYDYPGLYQTKGDGENVANVRLQEFAAPARLLSGRSPIRHFRPGAKITLSGHPAAAINTDWAFQSVTHTASRNQYENSFVALPATVTYRPARKTPKPRIPGTQTAIVTGKAGEEIWTDQYGRIKVQFHRDQLGKSDENSSCWIRVSQSWAGKGWGSWVLPRIGQEVVVSFIDGDPDRPLVTGCVYNGDFPLPYTLPADQTKTTIKSNSSKGGSGSNEIRFEDKAGSEEIFVHAQKDMNTTVENARTATINTADDTLTVAKGNRSVTISEGNDTLDIAKGNRSFSVDTGNETYAVKGTRGLTITGAETHTNKADYTWNVSGKLTIKVDGDISIEAGGALTLKSGTAMTVQSGTAMTVKSGTDFAGSSGTAMSLTGGTTLTAKGSASGTVDGGGMLTIKGGMVKIN